jgi:hypothetical protein
MFLQSLLEGRRQGCAGDDSAEPVPKVGNIKGNTNKQLKTIGFKFPLYSCKQVNKKFTTEN